MVMERKGFLWVGSEIHTKGEYGFPSEWEIVAFLTEKVCGKDVWQRTEEYMEKYNGFMKKLHRKAEYQLYPERMIRELSKMKTVDFLKELQVWKELPVNDNHRRIAYLLFSGMDIVTTNLDLCIELAYEEEFQSRMVLKHESHGVSIYKDTEKDSGSIYHLHGTIDNPFEMGVRLGDWQQLFSNRFRKKLDEWMTGEYTFYALGYPCRDFFDITVYLYRRARQLGDRVNWQIRFVTDQPRSRHSNNVRRFIQLFPKHKVVLKQMEFFLEELIRDYALPDLFRCNHRKAISETADTRYLRRKGWKTGLEKLAECLKPHRDLYLLKLSGVTGIAVEHLDASIWNRIESLSYPFQNMYKSLAICYRYRDIGLYDFPLKLPDGLSSQETVDYHEMLSMMQDLSHENLRKLRELRGKTEAIVREYIGVLRRKVDRTREIELAREYLQEVEDFLPEKWLVPGGQCFKYAMVYEIQAQLLIILSQSETDMEEILSVIQMMFLYVCQAASLKGIGTALYVSWFCYLNFYYKTGKKAYYDKAGQIKRFANQLPEQ